MSLHWDFETRGPVDLNTRGAYVYTGHPDTLALLASFKLNMEGRSPRQRAAEAAWIAAGGPTGELLRWRRGQPCPPFVAAYIVAGGEITAHNASFERLVFRDIMSVKEGWPEPALEQFRCTAVTAAAMSLPRSLDQLGAALDLPVKKDKRGAALMKIHSIPVGFDRGGKPVWHPLADDEKSMEEYHVYCDFDVLTEESAAARLIPLSDAEMESYWLNERVNDRGLRIDTISARAALKLAAKAKETINAEVLALTGGQVQAVTQVDRLKAWVASRGVSMPALDKDEIDDFLHDYDDLPLDVRRALELRAEGAKPSTEKIVSMLKRASADGRVRGAYLHHGAGQTGRFSSRGVQLHNMSRPRKIFEDAHLQLTPLFDAIRTGEPDTLTMLYGPDMGRPLHLLADAVRSFIWSAPGHDLLVADYSSIEGRLAPWFVDQEWKLEAYRALDRGDGAGLYEIAAAGIYGVPVESVNKTQRSVGKVAELALGFQGGAGALARMARAYKMKLASVYATLWSATSLDLRERVESRYAERIKKHDATAERLGRDGWIAAELIKSGWRAKNKGIVDGWNLFEKAAIAAVENPGEIVNTVERDDGTVATLKVGYVVAHGFLWCRLPSGRCLAYGGPKMREVEPPWADKTLPPVEREKKLSLTVRGVESQTGKWTRFPVYGGSLFNNIVQGSARDILVRGMMNVEKAGYPVVLHTHDEPGCEIPRGFGSVEEYERLLCDLPAWAKGLPLTASGWRGKRYRKA